MIDMATVQNFDNVPNIIDINFGNQEKQIFDKKPNRNDRLLGNFQGEIQIKGRYDTNKFVDNILKNEDKPLILCMQFKDPHRQGDYSQRHIYLQTSYKMCSPVQKSDRAFSESSRVNISSTSMIVNPPSSEKSPGDFSTNKEAKRINKNNKGKKQDPRKTGSTRSTLCEQLQNLLFPSQKKQPVAGQAKRIKNTPLKSNKGSHPNVYEQNIGDGKHVDSTKKEKDKHGDEQKGHRTAPLRGKDIGEVKIDGRRYGAIFFLDGDEKKTPDKDLPRKSRKGRWILDKSAQDLDRKSRGIPDSVPANTICRCPTLFPDGICRCREILQKLGLKETGPLYVPQSTPYPGSRDLQETQKQEYLTIYKDKRGSITKSVVKESDRVQRHREGNKGQINLKPSESNLAPKINGWNANSKEGALKTTPPVDRKDDGWKKQKMKGLNGDSKEGAFKTTPPVDRKDDGWKKKKIKGLNGDSKEGAFKTTPSQMDYKDEGKRVKDTTPNFCKCGYIPDVNRCKCIPIKYGLGKDPPNIQKECDGVVVIIPSKPQEDTRKINGESDVPEDIQNRYYYCGCTGFWIKYYPKDEKPAVKYPSDIIPGFSFKLESCIVERDKNNVSIEKKCIIRQQEIQRFKQSGYKNQPSTLIMNDPFSTPLRIYEVSALEGKRFISAQ